MVPRKADSVESVDAEIKKMIIQLLGLAPAGFSTAPDNGPWAMAEVVHVGGPLRSSG
jgi:hypothetical protein